MNYMWGPREGYFLCEPVGINSTSSIRRLRRSEKVRKSGERKSLLDLLNLYVVVLQAIRSSRLKGGQEALVTGKDQGVFCMEETTGNSRVCSVFLRKSKMHSGELSFEEEPQVGEGKSTCSRRKKQQVKGE